MPSPALGFRSRFLAIPPARPIFIVRGFCVLWRHLMIGTRIRGVDGHRSVPWLACVCTVLLSRAAPARSVVIDFEEFNLGGSTFLDVGSPLVFSRPGVTVTMNQGIDFRIYDLFKYGNDPAATGQALIDMNWSSFSNPNGTDIVFNVPVQNFSLRAGDFGSDDDSTLRIEAF